MDRIERICDLLDSAYGKQVFSPHNPPLDELVLTILSQNTTGENCRRAFSSLRGRFPTWNGVRLADEREIADAIRCGGLADTKSVRIKTILQEIYGVQGNLDLAWLGNAGTDEAWDYLLRFNGVGPKTAACVLLFSLGRPVLPVDTHVHRVSLRLGLIGPKVSAEKAHEVLQQMVIAAGTSDATDRVYSFHINMITHGRRVCVAGTPKCSICVLKESCDYFARIGVSRR
jgi:endonuclease-3